MANYESSKFNRHRLTSGAISFAIKQLQAGKTNDNFSNWDTRLSVPTLKLISNGHEFPPVSSNVSNGNDKNSLPRSKVRFSTNVLCHKEEANSSNVFLSPKNYLGNGKAESISGSQTSQSVLNSSHLLAFNCSPIILSKNNNNKNQPEISEVPRVSLHDFWRKQAKLSQALTHKNQQEIYCRGKSAVPDQELSRNAHSPPSIVGITRENNFTYFNKISSIGTPQMVIQSMPINSNQQLAVPSRGAITPVTSRIDNNRASGPLLKTERSERIRRRLLRQLRRRQNARKFITSQLAESSGYVAQKIANGNVENNDDAVSVSSSHLQCSSISSGSSAKTGSGGSSNYGDFNNGEDQEEFDQQKIDKIVTFVSELSFVFPEIDDETGEEQVSKPDETNVEPVPDKVSTSSSSPSPGPQQDGPITQQQVPSPSPVDGDNGTSGQQIEMPNNVDRMTVTENATPSAKVNGEETSPFLSEPGTDSLTTPVPPTEPSAVLLPLPASSNLLSIEDITALTSPPQSAPEPPVQRAAEVSPAPPAPPVEVCCVCGTPLSSDGGVAGGSGGKRGKQRNGSIKTGPYYNSTKSALANWVASRMTNEQMLILASFEDETANFVLAAQRQTAMNLTRSTHYVPSGWLPNPKVTASLSAPVKRRGAVNNQINATAPNSTAILRNNYFGYHDTRRKLPTSGAFKHYDRPEDHARLYRLQFTLADTGRYAEIWRASVDPSHPMNDPTKPVDEMLLIQVKSSKSFPINQSFCDSAGNDSGENSKNSSRLRQHRKSDGNNYNFDTSNNVQSAGESEPAGESEDQPSQINNATNNAPPPGAIKQRQATSDAIAVGSGPVFVWPPHQHPAPVVTLANANSQPVAGPPGPWPIRPWTLAQLEGKKGLNAKVSMLTTSIKNQNAEESSPTVASSNPLALQPLQPDSGSGTHNNGTGNAGSQPGSGNSSDKNNQTSNEKNSGFKGSKMTNGNNRNYSQQQVVSGPPFEVQSLMRDDKQGGADSFILMGNNDGNKKPGNRHGLLAGRRVEKAYKRTRLVAPMPLAPSTSVEDVTSVTRLFVNNKDEKLISSFSYIGEISANNKHRHHHRRRNSRTKLVPIDQANIDNQDEMNRRASFTFRPRTSNMPKNGGGSIMSSTNLLPMTNLVPFANIPRASKPGNNSGNNNTRNISTPTLLLSRGTAAELNNPKQFQMPHFSSADVLAQLEDENNNNNKTANQNNSSSKFLSINLQSQANTGNHEQSGVILKHDMSPRPKLLVTVNSTGS